MLVLRCLNARRMRLLIAVVCLTIFASCGSDAPADAEVASAETAAADDHDDGEGEDHDDGEGDDRDDDHDDGEDHDDDHGDDDHDDDEDHGDGEGEDHDDDQDEDHEGEDHDDHDDEGARGLGAHVHGEAELFVAWSGENVIVDLVSPSNNVFGFEYEPSTNEDLALVEEQTALLSSPEVLAFNDEAGCAPDADAEIETVFEGSHAEVTASWSFVCDNPEDLRQLDAAALFNEFPGFEDIDAQWASDTAQSAAELSPSSAVLSFE